MAQRGVKSLSLQAKFYTTQTTKTFGNHSLLPTTVTQPVHVLFVIHLLDKTSNRQCIQIYKQKLHWAIQQREASGGPEDPQSFLGGSSKTFSGQHSTGPTPLQKSQTSSWTSSSIPLIGWICFRNSQKCFSIGLWPQVYLWWMS